MSERLGGCEGEPPRRDAQMFFGPVGKFPLTDGAKKPDGAKKKRG